ncbi:hypothetical protein LUU34_01319000 [Aix galericulata]|nr:hypothetical protein LUU34_01319000 [Aix galericulata]
MAAGARGCRATSPRGGAGPASGRQGALPPHKAPRRGGARLFPASAMAVSSGRRGLGRAGSRHPPPSALGGASPCRRPTGGSGGRERGGQGPAGRPAGPAAMGRPRRRCRGAAGPCAPCPVPVPGLTPVSP